MLFKYSHLNSFRVIYLQKRQQLILSPLSSMSEIEYTDVRRKQIECLVNVLQSAGQQLTSDQWPTVIETVRVVVAGKLRLLFIAVFKFYIFIFWLLQFDLVYHAVIELFTLIYLIEG